jgi:threonine dehydratase
VTPTAGLEGVGVKEIEAAAARIGADLRPTPLERSQRLSDLLGSDVYFKPECLQRTGSFKLRGALNAVLTLSEMERRRGVVTASAGNHGLGLARAAKLVRVLATVFLPADAPMVKRERIRALGVEVHDVPGGFEDADREAERFARRAGMTYVHPTRDPAVVAGQGTVGLEICRELPDVGTILVPVGGGGLSGGIGLYTRGRGMSTRIVGVQSEATAAMQASLEAGRPRSVPSRSTLCDGLAGDVDAEGLALARRTLDDLLLVSEDAVGTAVRALYIEEGLVVEGSGAVGVAALREGKLSEPAGPVVVVLTGSNIDAARLAGILESVTESR